MTLPTDFSEALVAWPALANIRKAHGEPAACNLHSFFLGLQASEPERMRSEKEALDAVWGEMSEHQEVRDAVFLMSQQISEAYSCWDRDSLSIAAAHMPLSSRIVWLRLASQLATVAQEIREVMADAAHTDVHGDVLNYVGPSTSVHNPVVDGLGTGNQGYVI